MISDETSLNKLRNMRSALDQSSIMAMTNHKGIIRYVNDAFCEISKYSRDELIGKDHRLINSGYHPKSFFAEMWKTITSGKVWRGDIKNKAKDGSYYWVSSTIVPFLNEKGVPYQYLSIRNEITKLKDLEEEVYRLAYYDSLTNLPNRQLLEKYLQSMLLHTKQNDDLFAVLFLNLAGFKNINDSIGHEYGDQLLIEVAQKLSNHFYNKEFVARFEGDEFVVVLPAVSGVHEIKKIAEGIVSLFQTEFILDKYELMITVNIGICIYPLSAEDSAALIKHARWKSVV